MRLLAQYGKSERSPLLDYVAIAAILFTFNTVSFRSVGIVERISIVRLLACITLFLVSLPPFLLGSARVHLAIFGYAGLVFLSFLTSLAFHGSIGATVLQHTTMASALVFAASLRTLREVKAFLKRFVLVMSILAVMSLLFFVLGTRLGIIRPSGTVYFSWGQYIFSVPSYHGLHYEIQRRAVFGYDGYRNTGIFVEAPMYSFALCVAVGMNMLLLKEGWQKSIVLIAAVITTFSSTGFVSLLLMFGLYLAAVKPKSRAGSVLRIVGLTVLVVVMTISIWQVIMERSTTGSYSIRADHIAGCLRVFFDSFPFGCGYGSTTTIRDVLVYDHGISVGTAYLLAQGGVFSIALYIWPMALSFFRAVSASDWSMAVFQLVFAWLVFCTTVCYTLLFWTLVWITMIQYPILEKAETERII